MSKDNSDMDYMIPVGYDEEKKAYYTNKNWWKELLIFVGFIALLGVLSIYVLPLFYNK